MPLNDEQLRDAFNLFDTDRSGKISVEELAYAMQGLGHEEVTKEELEQMIGAGDTDSDGQVDFDEFKKLMSERMREADGPEEVLKAFQAFDLQHRGEITVEDLTEIAKSLGYLHEMQLSSESIRGRDREGLSVTPYDIQEIHSYCSANDDGHFTFYAWRQIMDEMKEVRGRGDAATYKEVGRVDDAIWKQLEEEEQRGREAGEKKAQVRAEEQKWKKERAEARRRSMAAYTQGGESAVAAQKGAEERIRRGSVVSMDGRSWEEQQMRLQQKRLLKRELQEKQRDEQHRIRAAEREHAEKTKQKLLARRQSDSPEPSAS